ncbi:sporulation protein YunB [Oceanobacillus halophilus]|uniref:Sporulation protein YunB n=1 Tax=Oceanobacillus halophilus TaxID=930130 RepID=A0A494ZTS6_9BACI|nr:sporulation protein YunB [Oceanobacillus halophilus]RKQ29610.1 sporulation protein YunB [Oceanobacillus halophilus]
MSSRKRFGKKRFAAPSGKSIFVISLFIFVICIIISMQIISRGLTPAIIEISETKTEEFATRAINMAVRFAEGYDFSDVLNITYDNEGHVATYNWNQNVVSEINRVATDRVEEFFLHMNRGDPISYDYSLHEPYNYSDGAEDRAAQDPTLIEVPLGEITGNAVLANLGPKIPINLELVGAVRTNIKRETEPLGINGSWVSLYVNVEADVQIIIPYITDVTTVQTEIYIDSGAIMGDVPDFYGGGGDGPSIAVPKDDIKNEEGVQEDLSDE